MKTIKVVIGAGFGDEGKGLMTDYFCREFPKNEQVLNVRFNGTSQAGHTVVTEDGRRHVFKHFGAGSFNENVSTYLAPSFVVDPIQFCTEYMELKELGINPRIHIDHNCKLILPFDALTNIFIEEARGKDKHGSCGVGLFESVIRNNTELYRTIDSDFYSDGELNPFFFIKYIRDLYYPERFKELGLKLTKEQRELFFNDNLILNYIADINFMHDHSGMYDTSMLNAFDYQVYEGAQGLLLSWDNEEYMPYLTASYTGFKEVAELLKSIKDYDYEVETCYVTRSYMTRHGAGPFETEVKDKKDLGDYRINEKTNVTNQWQDHFRYGYFDGQLLLRKICNDIDTYNKERPCDVSLAITHLDETKDEILIDNNPKYHYSVGHFMNKNSWLFKKGYYLSRGETAKTITNIIV